MTKIGIVGISGYAGYETLKIILGHPHVQLTYVSDNDVTGPLEDIHPDLKGKSSLFCKKFDAAEASELCHIIFLAVPHTVSMQLTPQLLERNVRVIDLSGDYRLDNVAVYERWYKKAHTDTKNLTKAVYGLPALYRNKIKNTSLLANPGCYPTAAILSLAPLVALLTKKVGTIVIDAKSGFSGAGKKAANALVASGTKENFKAYKILQHQHAPEIEQYLSRIADKKIEVSFVPHLLPIERGILETIYVQLQEELTLDKIVSCYEKFYKDEKFVRIFLHGDEVELKNVVYTNYCDIGFALNAKGNILAITSAIDNLIKGAAGQAVQNMNIMCKFKETIGLL